MTVSFHAKDNGRPHVCGHRGYSSHYPENTMLALEAARLAGATTCEIDVMLTRDDEIIVIHDALVDRTTSGHGYAGDLSFAEIRELDAAPRFPGRFPGARVPSLREVVSWATKTGMGVVIEMKERERPERLNDRLLALLRELDGFGNVIALSFNHVDLARLKEAEPGIRTEAILHARHVDMVRTVKACGAESVSIELNMFHPDDAAALHEAGISNRLSLPSIKTMAEAWALGRDPRTAVTGWIRAGHVDSLSCDDIPFARSLLEQALG